MGGGWTIPNVGVDVVSSRPAQLEGTWTFVFNNFSGGNQNVSVYAVCIDGEDGL